MDIITSLYLLHCGFSKKGTKGQLYRVSLHIIATRRVESSREIHEIIYCLKIGELTCKRFCIMFAPTATLISVVILLCVSVGQFATMGETETHDNMSNENPLTSHILDTSKGRPAVGVLVKLYKRGGDGDWVFITEQLTNNDGRISNLISAAQFTPAIYKLFFDTKSYFLSKGEKTFYPFIEVVFEIERPEEHYHVPILLNGFGYSTYRGS